MSMIAIGADRVIVRPQRGNRADGNRLFADIKVKKPGDLGERIHLRRLFFKPANQQHLTIEGKQIVFVHVGHYACPQQGDSTGMFLGQY